ncbi:MAG: hypothetical protein ACM3YE_00095 [Bacteroidota bacterium]
MGWKNCFNRTSGGLARENWHINLNGLRLGEDPDYRELGERQDELLKLMAAKLTP